MKNAKRRIATKAIAAFALLAACSLALAAQVAGTVVNLSGPLMVRKADGSTKVLAVKSEVEQGDTLVSEKNTYAQIKFIDNSEVTLKPGTTFKVEAFAYDSARPQADNASFTLVKGGLRSITGLLGKRNRDKFEMKTPTATIGIRGTTFVVQFIDNTVQPQNVPPRPGTAGPPGTGPLAPGLHVQVLDGAIMLSNPAGTQQFSAGQFGFVRSAVVAPVVVPDNPGLRFTPPPVFSSSTGPLNAAASAGKADSVDCEVR